MGVLPGFVLPAMFILLVISILVVTWHSHIAAIAVIAAVVLSPVGTFLWREDPSLLTQWLSAGGRFLAIAAVSVVIARAVFASGRVSISSRPRRGRALFEFRAVVFHHLSADGSSAAGLLQQSAAYRR